MFISNRRSIHARRGVPKTGSACLSVFLAALLILVQPALPSALRLEPTQATEAQALEGTSNYSDIFAIGNKKGTPGRINGSTLRAASTFDRSDYVHSVISNHPNDNIWVSSAAFVSKQPVSLLHDWVVKYDINKTSVNLMDHRIHSTFRYRTAFALTNGNNPASLKGRGFYTINRYFDDVGHEETLICDRKFSGEAIDENKVIYTPSWCPDSSSVTVTYSHSQNTLTYQWGSYSYSISSARSQFPTTAYIAMFSEIIWNYKNGGSTPPPNAYVDLAFKSMSMPHLEPSIEAPLVYPEKGNTPYGKDDMLRNGSVVRVECTVRNKYASPGSEQYPLYLKTVNDSAHPTKGVTPLIDSSHPLTVTRGSATDVRVTSASDANSIVGANGTPVTLVGGNETKVTYYAKVNQSSGEAIRLSQCLSEKSFHGAYYATTELFSEKALVEGPGGAAGANYSRIPRANDNGWNNTPVDVEFHANRTFDEFDIKSGGEVVETLTAGNARWGQPDDTDGMPLVYQARNTDIGISSTPKPDTIKIDTHTPTLTYDKAANRLTASDVSDDASHATSGVWKIIREGKQGQSVCAAVDGRVYGKQGGVWAATQEYSPLPGTYVAVDAAGNVSGTVEVPSLGLPSLARPEAGSGSGGDGSGSGNEGPGGSGGGDGSGNGGAYAGPVFTGALPEGESTTDENGLNHRVVQEGVFEIVDNSMDRADLPFGGTLDADAARQLIDRNYSFASPVSEGSPIDVVIEIVDARTNKPASPVDTSKTGEYIVRATATDAQGNTTTAEVACRIANKDDLPKVTPKPGKPNPDDVFGALIVGGDEEEASPLEARDVKLDEGTGKVTGTVEASLYIPRSDAAATPGDIATLISNRYNVDSQAGGPNITPGDIVLTDPKGDPIDDIDLSKTGTWIAEQTFTDSLGNTTTLHVTITNRKGGSSGGGNAPSDADAPAIDITPATDVRIDPDKTGTVDGDPYFEHDPDRPVNILDAIQVRPEGESDWTPITGGSGSDDGSGNGSGDGGGSGATDPDDPNNPTNPDGTGSPDGSGGDTGNGSGGTNGGGSGNGSGSGDGSAPSQLPDNVQVTVTDEAGRPVDPTNITEPGTYDVTISVKDPETDQFVVVDTLTFHVVDTSVTDTDYIYKDVAKDHWGHGYIFDIGPKVINGCFNPSDVALGYMGGYAGTTDFGPENGIIRGDAAIVIWRMAGSPDVEGDEGQSSPKLLSLANTYYTGFADCDADPTMYYNKAISWCAANGIVEGYGDTGEYRPQNLITREEFASIIARYAGFKGKDTSAYADLSRYPDIQDVSEWALPNMRYVVANGIMTGKGTDEGTADGARGILDPQAAVTRAEVAKMTYIEQPEKL